MKRATVIIPFATVLFSSTTISSGVQSEQASITLRPTLQEVRETRTTTLVEQDSKFSFPNDEPGIELRFGLSLPAGLKMLSLHQPDELRAVDSTQLDLTQIKEGYSGEREYVEIVSTWEEDPTDFTFSLSSATRTAVRFSIESQFKGVFYKSTETHKMMVTSAWATLPRELSGGQTVRIRAEQGNDTINLHVQPGTAKELFSELHLKTSAGESDRTGTMWNDTQATFWFDGTFEDSMELTLEVRVGLQEMPIYINLQDQPLP
jgi:hypothetical protein